MTTSPIIRDVKLNATPENVFDAFTLKEHIEAWFATTAQVDAENGGKWRYTWPPHMAAAGTFVKVDRPHKLIWTSEESIEDDSLDMQPSAGMEMPVVTNRYTFEADGDGSILHINESGHGTEEIREMNVQGIEAMIPTLRAWVEDGERVDWSVMEES